MGTPVVSLAGSRHSSRVGVSLLHAVGLEDWIANDIDEYIEKAVHFAQTSRPPRVEIRKKLQESALCDTAGFTADLEELYQNLVNEKLA